MDLIGGLGKVVARDGFEPNNTRFRVPICMREKLLNLVALCRDAWEL